MLIFPLAETERDFERFRQARVIVVTDRDAVLDDLDAGPEAFDFLVGINADDFAVDPDAEIALLLDELEELACFCFWRNGDPESDEDGFVGRGSIPLRDDRVPTRSRANCAIWSAIDFPAEFRGRSPGKMPVRCAARGVSDNR